MIQIPQTSPRTSQHYEVARELADCYASMADYGQARHYYRKAAQLAPQEAAPLVGLGMIAVQNHCLGEAESYFQQARRLGTASSEVFGALAIVYQQQQNYPAAFEMYLKCLELDSENLVALLGLFQTSCQMGTFAKIIQFLEIYLERHPGDSSVLFCLASLYAREGQLEQARTMLQSVLALEPDKPEAVQLMASVEEAMQCA